MNEGKVQFDEFRKTRLVVGNIVEAEPIEGSEKLLRLMVDLGEGDPRQLVAGIAKSYVAEDLVGTNIVVVANLAPAKLMGVESNGMLLAAHGEGGEPVLLRPEGDVSPGSEVS